MTSMSRLSLSVPPEVASDLTYLHRKLGISKSALVSRLLEGGLRDMRTLLESLPANPDPEDVVRFRGASAALITDRMAQFKNDVEASKESA